MEVDRGLSPESDESDEQDARNDRILDEVQRLLHQPALQLEADGRRHAATDRVARPRQCD